MNSAISLEKNNLTQLERKSRDLQIKLEGLMTVENDIVKTLQQLELNEVALKKQHEVKSQLQIEQDAIERQQTLLNDSTIREQQLLRQMGAAQEKLSRLQTQQEQRRQQIGQRLKQLQDEYAMVADERTKVILKIEQSEKVIKDFEAKMGDIRRVHEAEMLNLRSDCLTLKTQVILYTNEVRKSL